MKITGVKTLFCDAGWRPWIFVKITTDEGLVGYSEVSESFGSPHGIQGVIQDLEQYLVGKDPMAYENIFWTLYRITRQSPGSVIQKGIAGIENALLDIKGKALGVPVYDLFGGPTRDKVRLYWSHCGTTRVRSHSHIGKPEIKSYEDIFRLGQDVIEKGYTALKTNLLFPGATPPVLMQGFRGDYGSTDQNCSLEILSGLEKLMSCFREAVGAKADLILDLNFNFKTEGAIAVAKALEPFNLMWLELDCYHPQALRDVREATKIPICSGENLYTNRDYLPFFENRSMNIAAIDVIWNGFAQSKKIADLAELHDMNVAPHNHYSHFATFISAQFCAAIPNVRIMETDVDDVPWREELTTEVPQIENGYMMIPRKPGWGLEINEKVIQAHPWPKK